MATTNDGFPNADIVQIQEHIDMIREVLHSVSPQDKVYYSGILDDLYDQLREVWHKQSSAGPSRAIPHRPYYPTQMPSPPSMESAPKRKHSLEPATIPDAKRLSTQQGPVTPPSDSLETSPAAISGAQPPRPTVQPQFIDLTGSNTPSPISVTGFTQGSDGLDQFRPGFVSARDVVLQDPFPELNNAFQPGGDRYPPTYNPGGPFMTRIELSEYLLSSTRPSSPYPIQNSPLGYDVGPSVPDSPALVIVDGDDSDDSYGDTITGAEADAIEKLFENISHQEAAPEDREPTPEIMSCTLKEYQKIGLTWLLKMEKGSHKGGILADEMGLGKTVQALALMCANPPTNPRCKTTLIIAPVALMRQWEKEIERHIKPGHAMRVYMYHGAAKRASWTDLRTYDVVLTTFGTLTSEFKKKDTAREAELTEQELRNPSFRRHPKDELALLSKDSMFYRIIIDEAHNIKNREAKCSRAVASLQARHRLCMTGTPMMNTVDELYPLLRFLRLPQYIEYGKFSMEISRLVKHQNPSARKKGMDRLQIILKSIMLRRQKSSKVDGVEVCTIPPKYTQRTTIEFSSEELEFYKALENKSRLEFNRYAENGVVTANYANILVLLLRLRQACCHPHLIKDLSQAATSGISEQDLFKRAQELDEEVVRRLTEAESFECPICMEADPNMTIIVPCGHTVCGECVQRLIDPGLQEGNMDGNHKPRCPNCRGDLSAKYITDYKHFCSVHLPDKLGLSEEDEESETADESDLDTEDDGQDEVDRNGDLADFVVDDEDGDDDHDSIRAESVGLENAGQMVKRHKTKGKGKARTGPKKTLAQLKKESMRSRAAKKQYLRRLKETYIPSAKIDRTIALLEQIKESDPTEKTLIFSQFTSLLDLLEVPLHSKRVPYQRYDGSMKMDERADAVTAFMDDPNMNVMLVSLKAGNAGLNLWKASQVIILDPFWNPFIEDQAVDRAHRMPQTREVTIHRVLVPDTVEDRICDIQDKKRDIVETALSEEASKSLSRLGVADLRYLFGMG